MAHRLAPEAEADLDNIWYYIAKESGSTDIANRLIDSIAERFVLLASNPRIGRRRDEDLRPGLRSFPVGEYIIIYRVKNGFRHPTGRRERSAHAHSIESYAVPSNSG